MHFMLQVNWPIHSGNMRPATYTKRQLRVPRPIRILPYYVTANISSTETLNMLQADDGPITYTLNYFQKTLSVIPFHQPLLAPAGARCGPHVVVPADHTEPFGTGVINADYVYYITAVNDGIIVYIAMCNCVCATARLHMQKATSHRSISDRLGVFQIDWEYFR